MLSVVVDSGSQCASPLYPSIQAAVESELSGSILSICGGTYDEDVFTNNDGKVVTLSPGEGVSDTAQVVITGSLTLESQDALFFNINGDVPGTGHDQFVVGHDVHGNGLGLNGAALGLTGTRTAGSGQVIVLIRNDSNNPLVEGTLTDNGFELTEGSAVVVNGVQYLISYQHNASGSDGLANDVALIEQAPPPPPTSNTAQLITDPLNGNTDPNNQAIYVFGSSADNTINIRYREGRQAIDVIIDGTTALSVDVNQVVVTHIVVYAGDGNDFVQIDRDLLMADLIFGEGGNDELRGGGGRSALVGGTGDDVLRGREGDDILIGGDGGDHLVGGNENDILIGGTTTYDENITMLAHLLSLSLTEIPGNLIGHVANESTPTKDVMNGNEGSDLYYADLANPGKDKIHLTEEDFQPEPVS